MRIHPAPDFLQLAGHPLRWRLLGELAHSDRIVADLTARMEAPQNLVSYHLAKLRAGRLVHARRSDADGRDIYYGLDLARFGDALSEAGAALHPGLRLEPRPTAPPPPTRILFLCTGNSARSQMAEALACNLSGGAILAQSAGSRPRALHPNAVRVMAEDYGLDITGQHAKSLDRFSDQEFDWVISLCDKVREVCPEPTGEPRRAHWSLPNPVTEESDAVTYPRFKETAAALATRIRFLIATLAASPSKNPVQEPAS